jgi:hypothetical protein
MFRNTGDAPGTSHRRRHGPRGRGGERPTGETTAAPRPVENPPPNENIEVPKGTSPRLGNSLLPRMSPQTQPAKPADAVPIAQEHGQNGHTVGPVRPPISMESLETAASNLSIRDDMPPPKQTRQRGRNRGRSNVSKPSSPQRTFQGRTPSEEQSKRLSTGSRNDLGKSIESTDPPRKGILPITVSLQPPPNPEKSTPVVRLPELTAAPVSTDSHDSMNLIRSEDTDFGSDISRGAVQEGRLYNHKQPEKPLQTKSRGPQNLEIRPQEENAERQPRGLLRIQPSKGDQQQPPPAPAPAHRGGLLFIPGGAIKSNINTSKPTKPRNNQSSEFNRNVVPLRKEPDTQTRAMWNPDNIALRPSSTAMSHSGPRYVLTSDDILREVKTAYQEIQSLERKIKAIYESEDNELEIMRRKRQPAPAEEISWSTYSKIHKEYFLIQLC